MAVSVQTGAPWMSRAFLFVQGAATLLYTPTALSNLLRNLPGTAQTGCQEPS